jgi:hypothetical protein
MTKNEKIAHIYTSYSIDWNWRWKKILEYNPMNQ